MKTEPFPEAVETYTKRKSRWPKRPVGAFDVAVKVYVGESRKFNESDWVRNSGRFADYLGRGGAAGGGSGGAGTAEAIARSSAKRVGTTLEGWSVDKHADTQTLWAERGPDGEFQKDRNGNTQYRADRRAIHEKAVADITDHVPKPDGQPTYYVLGGGGGSGKSTLRKAGVIPVPPRDDAVSINADENKARLPEYQGMQKANNRDAAAIAHEESSDMTEQQRKNGLKTGKHVVLDGVGDGKVDKLVKKAEEARKAGYRVEGHYINIPTQEAVDRAEARYHNPKDESYGRYVPEGRLRGDHKTVSANFEAAVDAGAFDDVTVYDSVGTADDPKVIPIFRATRTADGTVTKTVLDQGRYDTFIAKGREDPTIRTIKALRFDLTDARIIVEKARSKASRTGGGMAEKPIQTQRDIDPEHDALLYMGAMRKKWPKRVPENPETRKRYDFYVEDIKNAKEYLEREGVPGGHIAITSDYDVRWEG